MGAGAPEGGRAAGAGIGGAGAVGCMGIGAPGRVSQLAHGRENSPPGREPQLRQPPINEHSDAATVNSQIRRKYIVGLLSSHDLQAL